MAPSVEDLVKAAMKASKARTPTELATAMGLGPWSPQKITRWIAGENKPSYEATIALLETAGWIRTGAAPPAASPVLPATVEAGVAELLRGQAQILAAIEQAETGRRDAPQAQPPGQTKARKRA